MTSSILGSDYLSVEGLDPCKILLLYEHPAGLQKGLQLCERLTSRFESQLPFLISQLSFDELKLDEAGQSVAAAADTDILLVCTQDHDLPPVVSDWLARCARSRTKDQGVFGLLVMASSTDTMPADLLLDHCCQAAQKLGMDYMPFLTRMEAPDVSPADAPSVPLAPAAEFQDNPGYKHWGLNE